MKGATPSGRSASMKRMSAPAEAKGQGWQARGAEGDRLDYRGLRAKRDRRR